MIECIFNIQEPELVPEFLKDRSSFFYYCFYGDVDIVFHGKEDTSKTWKHEWIAVFAFFWELKWILKAFKNGSLKEKIDFLEWDEQILFERDGAIINITDREWDGWGYELPFEVFLEDLERETSKFFEYLEKIYWEVLTIPAYQEMMKEVQ